MAMRRKSIVFSAAIVLLLGGAAALLVLLVRHEPAFYSRVAPPEGSQRKKRSGQFLQEFIQLGQDMRHYQEWNATFEQDCINSYFEEQFLDSGLAERILPEGVTAPRIAVEPDRIRLACRYGSGALSTVISINVRLWLVQTESNAVALELQNLHAGAIPIAAQSLLEQLSEAARQSNIGVTWYRYHGNPVALLRFQTDQDRPTIRFDHLVLRDGAIEIRGRSPDTVTRTASYFPGQLRSMNVVSTWPSMNPE
jgi:hypothetical protein